MQQILSYSARLTISHTIPCHRKMLKSCDSCLNFFKWSLKHKRKTITSFNENTIQQHTLSKTVPTSTDHQLTLDREARPANKICRFTTICVSQNQKQAQSKWIKDLKYSSALILNQFWLYDQNPEKSCAFFCNVDRRRRNTQNPNHSGNTTIHWSTPQFTDQCPNSFLFTRRNSTHLLDEPTTHIANLKSIYKLSCSQVESEE